MNQMEFKPTESKKISPEELRKLKEEYKSLTRQWVSATDAFSEAVKSGKGLSDPSVMSEADFSALARKIKEVSDKLKAAGLKDYNLDAISGSGSITDHIKNFLSHIKIIS